VWASRDPGTPALEVHVEESGPHTLTLRIDKARVELDQLWLSQVQEELPPFNEPVR
jgi:hypothetical protein